MNANNHTKQQQLRQKKDQENVQNKAAYNGSYQWVKTKQKARLYTLTLTQTTNVDEAKR